MGSFLKGSEVEEPTVRRSVPEGTGPLLDLLGAVTFQLDLHSLDVTFLSTSSLARLDQPPGQRLRGLSFWRATLPEGELSRMLDLFRDVALDGVARTLEHGFERTGKPSLWLRTSVMRHPDAEGALLGAMLDVSASRQNELQWREVESWLAALGEALPFDFWICDRDGRYVLQNPASERKIGNVAGRSIASVGPASQSSQSWESSYRRALQGESIREEHQVETSTGRAFFVRVVAPVWDAANSGEVHGVLGVDMDVTELKRVEERLRHSLEELARVQDAALRTRQLAAVGEMAAVIAHEVRNPLGSVVNALSLLRRDPHLPPAHLPLWQIIQEEADRIDWLVSNLLEFVRPMDPSLEPEDLVTLVDEALAQSVKTEDAAGKLRLTRHVAQGLPPVPVDRHLMRAALTHVFRNAVQATPPGGTLDLTISQERTEQQTWVRIAIRDDGPGVAPAHEHALFEPFFLNRSLGNGLALPIAKRVIHEHGGTVELTSEGTQGTTCVIRLRVPSETA